MKKIQKSNQIEGVKIWLTGFLIITIPIIIIELIGASIVFYAGGSGGDTLYSRVGIIAYFIQGILGVIALLITVLFFAVLLFVFSDVIYPIFWSIPIRVGRHVLGKDKELNVDNLTLLGV